VPGARMLYKRARKSRAFCEVRDIYFWNAVSLERFHSSNTFICPVRSWQSSFLTEIARVPPPPVLIQATFPPQHCKKRLKNREAEGGIPLALEVPANFFREKDRMAKWSHNG
jgi:hypothetical protein